MMRDNECQEAELYARIEREKGRGDERPGGKKQETRTGTGTGRSRGEMDERGETGWDDLEKENTQKIEGTTTDKPCLQRIIRKGRGGVGRGQAKAGERAKENKIKQIRNGRGERKGSEENIKSKRVQMRRCLDRARACGTMISVGVVGAAGGRSLGHPASQYQTHSIQRSILT
jgi:hypothetical protein